MIGKKRNLFIFSGNHKYKETDRIHSVHLSLKSHLLWVTLHLDLVSTSAKDRAKEANVHCQDDRQHFLSFF